MATSDVFSLYKNFKSLKPQDAKPFGVYIGVPTYTALLIPWRLFYLVHSNGSKEILVAVSGTIPVKIRGKVTPPTSHDRTPPT